MPLPNDYLFEIALSWNGAKGVVICTCLVEIPHDGLACESCKVKVVKAVAVVLPGNRHQCVTSDLERAPQAVRDEIAALIGKSIVVAKPVLEHNLLQFIEAPTSPEETGTESLPKSKEG